MRTSAVDPNPFVYDHPLAPEDLVDREPEADQLLSHAHGGHNSRLSAPRRFGKTSLLRLVMRDADRLGMPTVYVDFDGVVAVEEVAVVIEEAYRTSLQGPIQRAAVSAIRALRPSASAGVPGATVGVAPQLEPLLQRRLLHLLDLPTRTFRATGQRVLVIFDEFQELLAAHDRLDGLFRSRIQHHGDVASYVFAGSHPRMMAELFSRRERPFYGQARPLTLDPLRDSDLADYIGARFEAADRDPGEALEPLLDLVVGHPQRAMLVAHHLFEHTARGEASTLETLNRVYDSVFAELDEALHATWDSLTPRERATYAAVVWDGGSLYAAATLRRFGLSRSTASDARARLVAEGHLRPAGDRAAVDPLLAEWVRDRPGSASRR